MDRGPHQLLAFLKTGCLSSCSPVCQATMAGTFKSKDKRHRCCQLQRAALAAAQCLRSPAASLFSSSLAALSGLSPLPDEGALEAVRQTCWGL